MTATATCAGLARHPTAAQRQVLLTLAQRPGSYILAAKEEGIDVADLVDGDRTTRLIWNQMPALLRFGWIELSAEAWAAAGLDAASPFEIYTLTPAGRAWT